MHAMLRSFGDTGSDDVIVYNSPFSLFFLTQSLPLSVSPFLTLVYLPLVLESCEHGCYGHAVRAFFHTKLKKVCDLFKCSFIFISHSRLLSTGR